MRISLIVILLGVFGYTLYYLFSKSKEEPVVFSTKNATLGDVVKKTVATGNIKPREEVEIKPQVSGIIQELYVEAGDKVKEGDLIAKVKVIPNMITLNNAENRVEVAQISFNNAEIEFNRQQSLFDKGVISNQEYLNAKLQFNNAKTELKAANDNLDIVREGAVKGSGKTSLTLIKATISGMVLDVPVKVGNQVIESNNFNDGTTIASVADMSDLIFEGLIDESEVGKIKTGMDLEITIGAIEGKKFDAELEYIAPKGTEENGAIQFQIRAKVVPSEDVFIRAGYSANADIVLAKKEQVIVLDEGLIQYENTTPFVEVSVGNQQFERRDVTLGLSDGLQVEIVSGIDTTAQIKVWNGGS